MENDFKLKTADEVAIFEKYLNAEMDGLPWRPAPHFPLLHIWKWCQCDENGGRIFTIVFDLRVSLAHLWCDLLEITYAANAALVDGDLSGGTMLDSPIKFKGKLRIHRYVTSFIFRYRAIWDKIMGLLVILVQPDQYQDYYKSESKKRTFGKIIPSSPLADAIREALTNFDDTFRTHEAHGTGGARKWAFNMDIPEGGKHTQLLGFMNTLDDCARAITKLFGQPNAAN